MWVILGIIAAALILVTLVACKCAVEEDQLMQFHPPDNDDGVTLREDDPDGQYTR